MSYITKSITLTSYDGTEGSSNISWTDPANLIDPTNFARANKASPTNSTTYNPPRGILSADFSVLPSGKKISSIKIVYDTQLKTGVISPPNVFTTSSSITTGISNAGTWNDYTGTAGLSSSSANTTVTQTDVFAFIISPPSSTSYIKDANFKVYISPNLTWASAGGSCTEIEVSIKNVRIEVKYQVGGLQQVTTFQ